MFKSMHAFVLLTCELLSHTSAPHVLQLLDMWLQPTSLAVMEFGKDITKIKD
jgi:hypothetical protein